MTMTAQLDAVYRRSDDMVARMIEGELIIVPLTAGVGDIESQLFTLNESGKAIWDRLDGSVSLAEIAQQLADEFDGDANDIEDDVLGFVNELLNRGLLVGG